MVSIWGLGFSQGTEFVSVCKCGYPGQSVSASANAQCERVAMVCISRNRLKAPDPYVSTHTHATTNLSAEPLTLVPWQFLIVIGSWRCRDSTVP
jgi:hypothetical protein